MTRLYRAPATGLLVQLDPAKHYSRVSDSELYECLGLIPYFVRTHDLPLFDQLESGYGFARSLDQNYKFDEKGVMTYTVDVGEDGENDPPLIPYARLTLGEDSVYIYPYALVAVFSKNSFVGTCRMD